MTDEEKESLADAMAELLLTNGKVISALYKAVCHCPNLVVEY